VCGFLFDVALASRIYPSSIPLETSPERFAIPFLEHMIRYPMGVNYWPTICSPLVITHVYSPYEHELFSETALVLLLKLILDF